MKKIRIKLLCLPLMLLICLTAIVPSSAIASIEKNRTGSISVTLKNEDIPISGAEITLYKVADAEITVHGFHFMFTKEFAPFGGIPEDVQSSASLRKLTAYVAERNISGTPLVTDSNGTIRFGDLTFGLYLAIQTKSVLGYADCSPFVIVLPVYENNKWYYDIDASPKTDIARKIDITVKKEWNDDGISRPESIQVQLLKGEEVIDTVTLNEQNGWQHTWTDQKKSDSWSVKEISVPNGYTPTYRKNGFVFTVTNTPTLVQTGQLKWPIPVLALAGLALFALGWILFLGDKRKKHA